MQELLVTLKKETIAIEREVFTSLLDIPYVQEYASYQKAITNNSIKISDLKILAKKAEVPYPLFFAPMNIIKLQLEDNDRELESKMATKDEITLNFRGKMKKGDVALIVKDIARKQMFLKKHILTDSSDNNFIGIISKWLSEGEPIAGIAVKIREYFAIDLQEMRKFSKEKVLDYLRNKLEAKDIFISVSSFRYMPQEISKEINLSGFGVKDKQFPFIFLNTRDGQENPSILETAGRQIFTLLCMVVSIGQNKFVLSTKKGQAKEQDNKQTYSIVGEILIPETDLSQVQIENLEDLKEKAHFFKVTPSMLLTSLFESNHIQIDRYEKFMAALKTELTKVGKQSSRAPKPTTGYRKYNGERFSREIVNALNTGKISREDFKRIAFRKGNISDSIFKEYVNTFR